MLTASAYLLRASGSRYSACFRAVLIMAAVLLSVVFPPTRGASTSAGEFRAGAATSNITPPLGQLIVGGWVPTPAEYVHDELHARCLVLDDGRTRIAIVLCDNVGIPREVFDAAKRRIARESGIPPQCVLAASTHTHSATTARGKRLFPGIQPNDQLDAYQRFLVMRIADCVRCAVHNLENARLGWGSVVEASEVFNRRWRVSDSRLLNNPFGGIDQVRMNPPRGSASLLEPAGPTDPEIVFLSVQSTQGRPIALLANYSLHYVGGVPKGDISADYFGVFCRDMERRFGAIDDGPPFVAILSNGTSGDVNNINFRKPAPRLPPYQKMKQVAQLIARRVAEAHEKVVFQDEVSLAAAMRELPLGVRKPTQAQLDLAAEILALPPGEVRNHPRERIYAERWRALADAPDTVDVPIQVLRIGDVGIAAIPFEVFAEIGLQIKSESPLAKTFTIELANGSYGYLPTPRQHRLGGYETWLGTNRVEVNASDKITATVLELLETVGVSSR